MCHRDLHGNMFVSNFRPTFKWVFVDLTGFKKTIFVSSIVLIRELTELCSILIFEKFVCLKNSGSGH